VKIVARIMTKERDALPTSCLFFLTFIDDPDPDNERRMATTLFTAL